MGLVLVSHSGTLVEGLRDMVAQVAGEDVPVATAGGPRMGASGPAPRASPRRSATLDAGADEALVLLDLGSAPEPRARARGLSGGRSRTVRVSEAPSWRAPILAAVQASVGRRSTRSWRPPPAPRRWPSCREVTMAEIRLMVIDPSGLHARPAAQFVQAASRFASRIVLRQDGREADAKSLIALLGLTIRPSSEIHARGRRPRRGRGARRPGRGARPVRQPGRLTPPDHGRRKSTMSSPTLTQKLTAEAIGTAILVFIGAGSVPLTVFLTAGAGTGRRHRRPVDDLVLVRLRDLRRRLLGRPHQRLPHQPGGHDLAAGDAQDRRATTAGGYIVAQLVGAFIGAGLTLIILTGNDPAALGLGAVSVNANAGLGDRLRRRGHRHRDPRVHRLRRGGLGQGPGRLRRARSSASSSTGSSSSSARSPAPRSTRPARSAPPSSARPSAATTGAGRPADRRVHRRLDDRRRGRRLPVRVHRPRGAGTGPCAPSRNTRRPTPPEPDHPSVTIQTGGLPWPRTHPRG